MTGQLSESDILKLTERNGGEQEFHSCLSLSRNLCAGWVSELIIALKD